MKAIKKISLILCLTVLALTGMIACGNTKTEQKLESKEVTQAEKKEETKDKNKKVRTITDHAGNEIEVPEKVEIIVIDQIPILSTYMAYHHGKAPYMFTKASNFKYSFKGYSSRAS